MTAFIISHFQWILALHVIAVISWMAGMLYLPRLYVYHARADKGSELAETLKTMERKLLRIIINPAMISASIFGLMLLDGHRALLHDGWMHVKLTAALGLSIFHAFLSRWRKAFLRDETPHTANFFRIINEVPSVLMVIIVIMVIVKPF